MQVSASFQKLYHVAFDLRFGEMHGRVFEKSREVVVHVRCHHEHARFLLRVFASLHSHFLQLEYVDVVELFE